MRFAIICDDPRDPQTQVALNSLRTHHPSHEIHVLICDPLGQSDLLPDGIETHAAIELAFGGWRYVDVLAMQGLAFARWWASLNLSYGILAAEPESTLLCLPHWSWVRGSLLSAGQQANAASVSFFPTRVGPGVTAGGFLPDSLLWGQGSADSCRWWLDDITKALDSRPIPQLEPPWAQSAITSEAGLPTFDMGLRLSPRNTGSVRELEPPSGEFAVTENGSTSTLFLAHMEGFEPEYPWRFSADTPRAADGELKNFLARYSAELMEYQAQVPNPTGQTANRWLSRLNLSPTELAAFRVEYSNTLASDSMPPTPWIPADVERYLSWQKQPDPHGPTGVSRAADAIWNDRPDLQLHFPEVRRSGRDGFVRWLWTHGLEEGVIDPILLPEPAGAASYSRLASRLSGDGVNLVGYHDSELGLGVAVRRLAKALDAACIPWTPVNSTRNRSRQRPHTAGTAAGLYDTNIFVITADQLPFAIEDLGADFFADRYNIGYWFWEADVLTPNQQLGVSMVDEIWAATSYLEDIWSVNTALPVSLIPTPLEFEQVEVTAEDRNRLGLDGRFTFLFSFDFLSTVQRKNPFGMIEAYTTAFGPLDETRLIIKTINGDKHPDLMGELTWATLDRTDIELRDGYISATDRLKLVAGVDAYVSLHRSEGLGLTLAEAMAVGTPVIATGYSGNMDFMNTENSLLVEYDLVSIGPGSFYPANGKWAEPNLVDAAKQMRRLRSDPTLHQRLSTAGKSAISQFDSGTSGRAAAARLRQIRRMNSDQKR